ncbi:glutamate--cysteine ligase [Zooshikella ganghwensis]|uniref:Glutamate--cysteine ligase n=1 Tax=Zooshikella ganghwensis TaxID=202772 RepID=A0A4P9VJ60_9GAMM|nr:glutamate--cysteine ligase [Zooshikella ganghwensis]RDH43253.1 glutamate--cysteine ligase [Zooshikella ganghwensis]
MGLSISHDHFTANDYLLFTERLHANLSTLQKLLQNPDFGQGPGSIGAELEMYIVDDECRPTHLNQRIANLINDPQLTLELNQFNLEYNLSPVQITHQPFRHIAKEINCVVKRLNLCSQTLNARILPIGILPTLEKKDISAEAMTDIPRYHALSKALRSIGDMPFQINIDGSHPLQMLSPDITMEGANTSFQIHYRVSSEHFARRFNAIQLVTPIVLALGANSPTLFGHALWQETRIALFKHSVENRNHHKWHHPARVNFGTGWVREGAFELFAEAVYLYAPILPITSHHNSQEQLNQGITPALDELRLHQSSVWPWNRPVYDPAANGHLRIEMRALPAGPTIDDMVANAAFLIGIAEGLNDTIEQLIIGLPFNYAKYNFYEAAKQGLDAALIWPDTKNHQLKEISVVNLATELLPTAEKGLYQIGIAEDEVRWLLGNIKQRLEQKINGASWQLKMLNQLKRKYHTTDALKYLTEHYIQNFNNYASIVEWPEQPCQ